LLSETTAGEINGAVAFSYNNDFKLTGETVSAGTYSHSLACSHDNDGLLVQAGDYRHKIRYEVRFSGGYDTTTDIKKPALAFRHTGFLS